MRPLTSERVQRIEPSGILYVEGSRLVVWGIHGANDSITGLYVHDTLVERCGSDPLTGAPRESVDALRERVMRTIVADVPASALRDRHGSVVGYFVYEGLPSDHCREVAEREGRL